MNNPLIQSARDIVADAYLKQEGEHALTRQVTTHTPEAWAKHVADYATFTREGAYDDDLAVVATLAALRSIDVGTVLLAVVDATRAYLPPDGISEQECINRILQATDNREVAPLINAADDARSIAA